MEDYVRATAAGATAGAFWPVFAEFIEAAANRRFGPEQVEIEDDRRYRIHVNLLDPLSHQVVAEADFWPTGEDMVEWQHSADEMSEWLRGYLGAVATRKAALALAGHPVVLPQAAGPELWPDFDICYPRFCDWQKARAAGHGVLPSAGALVRKLLPARQTPLMQMVNAAPEDWTAVAGQTPH